MEPINSFADVAIFSRIDSEGLEFLNSRFTRRTFRKNEIIFHQDDPGDRLFILVSGLVKISLGSEDGRESDIALLSPGDCFGEMSVLDGGPRSATATAVEHTETITLSSKSFLEFLNDYPKAVVHIFSLLVERLRVADETIIEMAYLDVPTKVVKRLLKLAQMYQNKSNLEAPVTIVITHEELGKMVGASREAVNRTLNKFGELGLVKTLHGKIVIEDLEELQRIAAP